MEIARWNRTKQQRYGLVGERCPHCGAKFFPPGKVADCPQVQIAPKQTETVAIAAISLTTSEISISSD